MKRSEGMDRARRKKSGSYVDKAGPDDHLGAYHRNKNEDVAVNNIGGGQVAGFNPLLGAKTKSNKYSKKTSDIVKRLLKD